MGDNFGWNDGNTAACRFTYMAILGNSHEIEGHTLDVSLGGARFESDLDVSPGKTIIVRLVVPGAESALSIPEARVRWVDKGTFGVEFHDLEADDLDDLEELIDEFDEAEESGHA